MSRQVLPPAPTPACARTVSIVLHPFLVLSALALLAAWRLAPESLSRTAVGLAVAVAVFSAFIWQRRRGGHWETVDASRPQERPLLYGLALLLAGGYWCWTGGEDGASSAGILVMVAMLCVAGLANRWIKLSLHMASLAFAAMAAWRLSLPVSILLLCLLPVQGWSRLRLGRHRLSEVIGGSVLGLLAGVVLRVTA